MFFCVCALTACGEAAPPLTDAQFAAQVLSNPGTSAAASAYYDCVTAKAATTPNGREALDLRRIDSVLEQCRPQEEALEKDLARAWAQPGDAGANEGRRRGIKGEAIRLVRANPYVPATVFE